MFHVYYYSNHELVYMCHVLDNWVTGVMPSWSAVVCISQTHQIYESHIWSIGHLRILRRHLLCMHANVIAVT